MSKSLFPIISEIAKFNSEMIQRLDDRRLFETRQFMIDAVTEHFDIEDFSMGPVEKWASIQKKSEIGFNVTVDELDVEVTIKRERRS